MMGVTRRIAVKQQQRRNNGNFGGSSAVVATRLPSLRGGDTREVRRVFPNQVFFWSRPGIVIIINKIIINKIIVHNYFVLSPLYLAARSAAGGF